MPSEQYERLFATQTLRALHKRHRRFAKYQCDRDIALAIAHYGPGEHAPRDRVIERAKAAYEVALKKADLNLQTRLACIAAKASK